MICSPAYGESGVSMGYGYQSYMYGYNIGIQHKSCIFCENKSNQGFSWPFWSYWDFEAYDFQSKGNTTTSLYGGSIGHVFRIERRYITCLTIPYLEAGLGLALFNRETIADRNMGTRTPLLLKFGFGMKFGNCAEFDLGYKFVNFFGFLGKQNQSINAHFAVLNFWF